MNFTLKSTTFEDGQPIPPEYTGDGRDDSPPLSWENMPEKTVELALVVEDSDAAGGDFVHWVLYHIPPQLLSLDAGLPTDNHPDAAVNLTQGRNDFGRTGYKGPAPPPGKVHHYHFRLMALDTVLQLPPNADKGALRQAVRGHVIGEAELVGTYQR